MSVLRPRLPEEPLAYEAAEEGGRAWEPGGMATKLAVARDRILARPERVDLPSIMLAEYDTQRRESRLFAILTAARQIRDSVDRLVIIAGGTINPATRLLAATCCHPFHDQLPRGERGGRPRLLWLDRLTDPDTLQGLLDLVAPAGLPRQDDLFERWGVMPVELPGHDPLPMAILHILLGPLAVSVGDDARRVAERVVPVAAAGGELTAWALHLGCPTQFVVGADIASPQGVFTAAGLLPASVAGLDVVRLLKGAEAMLRRFAEAPVAENPPLIDAAVAHQAAGERAAHGRRFIGDQGWRSLFGQWHAAAWPSPLEAAGVVTRLISSEPRRERLVVPPPAGEPSSDSAALTWGQLVATVSQPVAGEAAATIRLPRVDEHAIGQLLQLCILSAAVEERLREGV